MYARKLRIYIYKRRPEDEEKERIQSGKSACAREPPSARGTHVFRFLLISLAFTATSLRDVLDTRVHSHERTMQDNENEGSKVGARILVVALREHIQQVISRYSRRHFYYREIATSTASKTNSN